MQIKSLDLLLGPAPVTVIQFEKFISSGMSLKNSPFKELTMNTTFSDQIGVHFFE